MALQFRDKTALIMKEYLYPWSCRCLPQRTTEINIDTMSIWNVSCIYKFMKTNILPKKIRSESANQQRVVSDSFNSIVIQNQ